MDFHGITMKGPLVIEQLPILPPHDPLEQGRIIFVLSDNNIYVSGSTGWFLVAGAGTSLPASSVSVVPFGGISSTNVQQALQEIDAKIGSSYTFESDQFILNGSDITNKFVNLTQTPIDENTINLKIKGAPSLLLGEAFDIGGSPTQITWSGLDLDGILSIGDIVQIQYISQ